MQLYAKELAELLPSRFTFKHNGDRWFVRDEELKALDMRSNGEAWEIMPNAWKFLSPLCHEYGVKNINADDNESLEEAAFKALIMAVRSSTEDLTAGNLDEQTRRHLLKQLVDFAPEHIHAKYDGAYDYVYFDNFEPSTLGAGDTRRIYLNGDDFSSICGSLVLLDELERSWEISIRQTILSDCINKNLYDGYEVHLRQIVDSHLIPIEYTIATRTRCESIVRAAIAVWSG